MVLVDLPGFNDTDQDYSLENDISTSFGICNLFNYC